MLHKGAARNKLVLGVALFGPNFIMKNAEGVVGFQKLIEGVGPARLYVQQCDFCGYNEVSFCLCDGISRRETERVSA